MNTTNNDQEPKTLTLDEFFAACEKTPGPRVAEVMANPEAHPEITRKAKAIKARMVENAYRREASQVGAMKCERRPRTYTTGHGRARRAAPCRARGSRRSSTARSSAASGDPSHRTGADDGEPARPLDPFGQSYLLSLAPREAFSVESRRSALTVGQGENFPEVVA